MRVASVVTRPLSPVRGAGVGSRSSRQQREQQSAVGAVLRTRVTRTRTRRRPGAPALQAVGEAARRRVPSQRPESSPCGVRAPRRVTADQMRVLPNMSSRFSLTTTKPRPPSDALRRTRARILGQARPRDRPAQTPGPHPLVSRCRAGALATSGGQATYFTPERRSQRWSRP